jgi:hypothetical protein
MVALVIASVSAFVSCKDYDDDINNLQKQIDAKAAIAQIESLQSQLASAQSAAQAAQADATKALADAAAAAKTAGDAATAKALEDAIAKVNAAAEKAATENAAAIKAAADAAAAAGTDAKAAADAAAEAKAAAEKAYTDALEAIKAEIAKIEIPKMPDLSGYATKSEILTEAQIKALIEKNAQAKGEYVTATSLATQLDELKKTIPGAVDLTEINNAIASYDGAISALYSAVTSVELVQSFWGNNYGNNWAVDFLKVTEKANTWPAAGVADAQYTFEAGKYYVEDQSVLVRVSPINATLTKENLKIINSQGVEFPTDVVSIKSVEPYTELLTRTTSESGLWEITFALNREYVPADFDAAAGSKNGAWQTGKMVLYAVAVNNTSDEDSRFAVSSYDLTFETNEGVHAELGTVPVDANAASGATYIKSIDGWKNLINVNNRFSLNGGKEYEWKQTKVNNVNGYYPQTTVTTNNVLELKAANVATFNEDRRSKNFVVAKIGEPIEIAIDYNFNAVTATPTTVDKKIKGFYVTLDKDFAETISKPSELNAWNSYSYENVGYTHDDVYIPAKLQDGNYGTITINDMNNVQGDIIGFRIFAINLDGTLLDPDGKAFYVLVGDEASSTSKTGIIKVSKKDTNAKSTDIDMTGVLTAGRYYTLDINANQKKADAAHTGLVNVAANEFTYQLYKGNTLIGAINAGARFQATAAQAEATKIVITATGNAATHMPQSLIDNYVYGFTLKGEDKYTVDGNDIYQLTQETAIAVTKTIPATDEFPETFRFLPGQESGSEGSGKFIAYLEPENGYFVDDNTIASGSSEYGFVNLKNVFDLRVDPTSATSAIDENYKFTFAASQLNKDKNGNTTITVTSAAADDKTNADPSKWIFGNYKLSIAGDADSKVGGVARTAANRIGNYIDNTTEHALTVNYVYPGVSTTTKVQGGATVLDKACQDLNAVYPSAISFVYSDWSYVQSWGLSTYASAAGKNGDRTVNVDLQWTRVPSATTDANMPKIAKSLTYFKGTNTYNNTTFGKYLIAYKGIFAAANTVQLKLADGTISPYFKAEVAALTAADIAAGAWAAGSTKVVAPTAVLNATAAGDDVFKFTQLTRENNPDRNHVEYLYINASNEFGRSFSFGANNDITVNVLRQP